MKLLSVFWHSVDHGMLSADSANPTVSSFRKQLKFLKENYTPVTPREFLEIRSDKHLRRLYAKPPVLLGFDDGFKNVIRLALPILAEFEVPAVFFVIGSVLHSPDSVPWYVERKQLIRKAVRRTVVYGNRQINLSSGRERTKLKDLFDVSFKACPGEKERETLMTSFASVLGVERPKPADLDEDLKFVDRDDLANLGPSSLITVASHGLTHRNLASLSYEDQVLELEESNRILSSHCPSYYPVIAYPNGSFNSHTLTIARRVYKGGFAVLLGASYRNPYAYPRIGIGNDSVQELAYAISAERRNYVLPIKKMFHIADIRKVGTALFHNRHI